MSEPQERPKNWMWRHQQNFLSNAQGLFTEILKALNCKLWNNIALIGFATDGPGGMSVVRAEPQWNDLPLLELTEMFDELRPQLTPYPDDEVSDGTWNDVFRSHEITCRDLKDGIQNALKDEYSPKHLIFCSDPYQVANHLISMVMLVSRADYESQPHLSEEVSLREHGVRPSFLYTLIEWFLEEIARELPNPNNGTLYFLLNRNPKEFLRTAAARFTHTAARPGTSQDLEQILKLGAYDLFNACGIISSQHYEGGESKGHLVISERGHTAITMKMEFAEPVDPNDHRKIRKLLEMCEAETWLLFSTEGVYGLGFVANGAYDPRCEDLFVVKFVKHHCWELVHDKQVMMCVTYNEPSLPQPKFDQGELKRTLKENIRTISDEDIARLINIATLVSEANTGTMLVITPEAATETKRLANQCFPVKPFLLSDKQIPSVLEIDGAVLLDEKGSCHALGAILDGRSTEFGTSARGSRYNSAIRYVQEHADAVALVVSEDGMVNVVTFSWPSQPGDGRNATDD